MSVYVDPLVVHPNAPTTEEVRDLLAKVQAAAALITCDEEGRAAINDWEENCRLWTLPIAEHRDALAAEVARLRPLAELGALALAWGRALRECETARTAPERRNVAADTANAARAAVAKAAMRMAEEEQER